MSNPYFQSQQGGFVGGDNASPMGASQSPGGNKGGAVDSIRPVTIKQLHGADHPHPDAKFYVDGFELAAVRVVGVVRNIAKTATNVSYTIEDGTGQISVRRWWDTAVQQDDDLPMDIEQDVYVVVIGLMKAFTGSRHIHCHQIRPIKDFNQVHYHLMEALYMHLSSRKPMTSVDNTNTHADYLPGGMPDNGDDDDRYGHCTDFQRTVLQAIKANAVDDEGVHVGVVARTVGNGRTHDEVMTTIESLIEEGICFSVNDDLHVAICG